jgi:hypothetical protein
VQRWLALASVASVRYRQTVASVALVLSELTPVFPVWQEALKGWNMRESTVVQGWIDEGEAKGLAKARRLLIGVLKSRFGAISDEILARIDKINDFDTLEKAAERVFTASSADEVLPA